MTSIEWSAFYGCTSLTSVLIPDSVTSIDSSAFDSDDLIIKFQGTKAQWDKATKEYGWTLNYKKVYYNYFSVDASFKLAQTSYIYTGSACKPSVTVTYKGKKLIEGTDFTISYKDNINIGTASVVIIGKGNYTGTVTKTFAIAPKNTSGLTISGIADKTYNGKAQTQFVAVKNGTAALKNGTDYTVSYKNNINAGTASIVITGKGNYTGAVSKTFAIKKAANSITASNFIRSYSVKAQSFALGAKATGGILKYKSDKSSVKVTKSGKVKLPAKFSGIVKITITASNNNYDTATKAIRITVPSKTKLSSASSPSAGKMKIKWKKNTKVTGYQIQYGRKRSLSGAKKVTISKNTAISKTVKGLKKGKTYYVRIRSFKTVNGKKYYSSWSTKKAVAIKK